MGEQTQEQALIMIYTGSGKGKTSAAVGQAVRAMGAGLKVAFGQFLKRDNQAGEQKVLKSMLKNDFLASGVGFYRDRSDRQKHREGAIMLINWAHEKISSKYQLLILDEAIYALKMGLITREELQDIIDKASRTGTSIVLTGRDTPEWLREKADMVSEILEEKHHFHKNISARKGIEY